MPFTAIVDYSTNALDYGLVGVAFGPGTTGVAFMAGVALVAGTALGFTFCNVVLFLYSTLNFAGEVVSLIMAQRA